MKVMKKVRIGATSDIHGFLERLEDEIHAANLDILVIAGDIHPCRIDVNADTWFHKKFFPFVKALKIPVIVTPGNHDFWLANYLSQIRYDEYVKQEHNIPKNFHLLCDEYILCHGVLFYGTPWVPWINGQWCFECSEETLKYHFSNIPKETDVLITHTPPQINHQYIDISKEHQVQYWRHFGSKALTQAIKTKQPKVNFCGHIHSGDHKCVSIKCDTPQGEEEAFCDCYNVSRVNEKYQVTYPIRVIEFNASELVFK
jgi:Icc-related predicted phosphoesterase